MRVARMHPNHTHIVLALWMAEITKTRNELGLEAIWKENNGLYKTNIFMLPNGARGVNVGNQKITSRLNFLCGGVCSINYLGEVVFFQVFTRLVLFVQLFGFPRAPYPKSGFDIIAKGCIYEMSFLNF